MEEKKEEETTANTTGGNANGSDAEKNVGNVENKEVALNEAAESVAEEKKVDEAEDSTEKKDEAEVQKTFTDVKESEKKEKKTVSKKSFIMAVLVILLIVLGFVYFLEKEQKVTSNLFSGVIPVAKVDGKAITVREYENNYRQLEQQARTQGYDTQDPEIVTQIKDQVIENLINFELLRREAKKAGKVATEEDVQARLNEIIESIGGEELLGNRLTELGIDKSELLREVEDDIIIQKLFEEDVFPESEITVSEEEILEFYEQLGNDGMELPSFEDIKEQISQQIETNKQQKIIGEFLEELKNNSTIEIVSQ